jgi:hypothetical protein
MPGQELINNFVSEISRSILIDDADKEFWTGNSSRLPEVLLKYFYDFIKEQNALIDESVAKALEQDPQLLAELKKRVSVMKNHILTLKEESETKKEKAEDYLSEELRKI